MNRIHLETFSDTLENAIKYTINNFTDEAGFYDGVLIEERSMEKPIYRGKRLWYKLSEGKLMEIEEPSEYKNVFNLI